MKINNNMRRFFIILTISLLIIGCIIYFTSTKQTLTAIKNMNIKFFMLGVFFYLLDFTTDALRTKILIKGTGHQLGLLECCKVVALNIFFNLITPFNVGGQPFQIYALQKEKMSSGSATTVVFTKLFFGALSLILFIIYGLIFHNDLFISVPTLVVLVKATGFIMLFLIMIFILSLYNHGITMRVITFILKIFWKLKICRHPDTYKNKILKQVLLARKSFNGLVSHKILYSVIGFLLSFIMTFAMIMMVISFIWGFGIDIPLKNGIILTSALIFLIIFIPTPGSSGLGEGIFYLLYNQFIPNHLIGVCIFLWRFFSRYITAILGAIVSAKYFSDLFVKKGITKAT